jgi:hypothetical protein
VYYWEPRVIPINGCFSQRLDEKCTVETSLFLLGVIIAFISCKTLCMFWILWRLKEYPLAVVGDAIASFMEESDKNTKSACLGAASTFNHTQVVVEAESLVAQCLGWPMDYLYTPVCRPDTRTL